MREQLCFHGGQAHPLSHGHSSPRTETLWGCWRCCDVCSEGCLSRMAKWEDGSKQGGPGEAGEGVSASARCGSAAVCVPPGPAAPTAHGAPAARGACGVRPSLHLWKSLIEMQVIKSNVSRSIQFHCTTTFTSLILSDISAAPLSVFSLVRAMPILSPLCERGREDNSKPAVGY